VKSPFHFSPAKSLSGAAVAAPMLLCVLLLAGCGQKGPLYMPKPPAPHPDRTAPVPAAAIDNVDGNAAVSVVSAPQSK